jgi:hypothetical protein
MGVKKKPLHKAINNKYIYRERELPSLSKERSLMAAAAIFSKEREREIRLIVEYVLLKRIST